MAPTLPVYLSVRDVAQHFDPTWTIRKVRETLEAEGVVRVLAATPGRPGKRRMIVTDLLRERLPEVYRRVFEAALE